MESARSSTVMPSSPNFHEEMNTGQIDRLLQKVNLSSTFVRLATEDEHLIQIMKRTIDYQREVMSKREKLLLAIVSNVKYLSNLHK